jgi:hypothetical protein
LALWIFYTELNKLDAYFSVSIGIILYIVFIASFLYRKHVSDKTSLEILKAELQSEEIKTFTEKVQAQSISKFTESKVRSDTLNKVIAMLEETLNNKFLLQKDVEIYVDLLRRVKDMAKAYSPF